MLTKSISNVYFILLYYSHKTNHAPIQRGCGFTQTITVPSAFGKKKVLGEISPY